MSIASTQVKIKSSLKLEFEDRPSAWIPEAILLSEDLRCKIKENVIVQETKGKAYIVDQIKLSDSETMTTIVQQNKNGAWVGMEIIHPSSIDLKQSIREIRAVEKDQSPLFYPLFLMIGVLLALEAWMLWKTAVKKEPILITAAGWRQIVLGLVILLLIQGWFTFYVFQRRIHYSLFTATRKPVSRSFQVRLAGKRYTLECPVYTGFFWNESMPDELLFGFSAEDVERILGSAGEHIMTQIRMLRDQIRLLREKIMLHFENMKMKEKTWQKKKNEVIQSVHNAEFENLSSLEKEEKHAKNEFDAARKEYLSKKAEIEKAIAEDQQKIQTLITQYKQVLENLRGQKITDEQMNEILHSQQIIASLRDEKAQLRDRIIALERSHAGMYEELMQVSETINERVYEGIARHMNTNYEVNILNHDPETGLPQSGTIRENEKVNWNVVLPPLFQGLTFLMLFGLLIYSIRWFSSAFAVLHPVVAILLLIAIIVVAIIVSSWVNKVISYSQGASETKKVV